MDTKNEQSEGKAGVPESSHSQEQKCSKIENNQEQKRGWMLCKARMDPGAMRGQNGLGGHEGPKLSLAPPRPKLMP